MRNNAPNRMLGRCCVLGAGIPVEIWLRLGKDELARKTGDLPVARVLKSLVLRGYFF
jgi:hypothetical protein